MFLIFLSCATSPKAGAVKGDGSPDFSVLPAGAEVYLWADVERARPILEALSFAGLEGKNASQVLERTDTAVAALYGEGAPRRFFMAGWGKYPNLRAGFSMGLSRDWKKIKSETGSRYWYSKSNNLGVALGSDLAFASDGDPFFNGAHSTEAPLGFEKFRRSSVLSLWLNEPAVPLNRFMDNLGIPIQIPAEDLFLGAVRIPANATSTNVSSPNEGFPNEGSPNLWELVFRIKTQSVNQARSLLTIFSMARYFVQQTPNAEIPMEIAALLFANPPELEGEFLTIRTPPLSEGRIALLLQLFTLYSN